MIFTALINAPEFGPGGTLVLIPAEHAGGPPFPVLPPGTTITISDTRQPETLEVVDSTAAAGGMTVEFVVRRTDGRLFRVKPQRPGGGSRAWEPNRGMTVWDVAWQVEG